MTHPLWRHRSALALALMALVGCARDEPRHAPAAHADDHADDGADAHGDGAVPSVVSISAAALARNRIRVGVAKGGRLGAGVEAPAEIGLAPDQIAHVTLLVPGRITQVKKTVGDKVKAGELMAFVESAELGAAQSARAQADAELNVARKSFERQKELKAAGIGTQRAWDEAEAAVARAEADLAAATQRTRVYGSGGTSTTIALRAPLDGEIVERHASVGEVAEAGGDPLFVIANLQSAVAFARVYERDVAKAVVGAPVRLTLQAYPGESWESQLDYVSPRLDEKSRTLLVRATLKNDGRLKPGLFGTVTLLAAGAADTPRAIVPVDAVQRGVSGDVVFVPVDDSVDGAVDDSGADAGAADGAVFRAVPVVKGVRRGGEVEVEAGLDPGARVVVEGAFVVKSELLRGALGAGHAD